jgi:hypothetical protein
MTTTSILPPEGKCSGTKSDASKCRNYLNFDVMSKTQKNVPNLPAKNGNDSGKGRGNNPPGPGKTPPPPPKKGN